MANLLFIDSAFPLGRTIAGVQGIAFYIGGDTPHVWSKAEIDAEPYQYRLPIFVRSNPPGPGAAADVAAAVEHLLAIGAPQGTLVAWDMETAADAAYMAEVYALLRLAGYTLIVYASQSFISGQGNPDGLYWGAQWTNMVHIAVGDAMTQYADFGPYDESDAPPTLPFWNTKGATPPPPPPPTANPWPLQAGSNGPNVVTLQEELNRGGYAVPPLAADGAFGPLTLAAVRHAQGDLGMEVTGIVDERLWDALRPVTAPYPAPSGITTTVTPAVVIRWQPGDPVSPHWRVQVAADAKGRPGAVITTLVVTAPSATLSVHAPGAYWYRLQAAGNSPFTAWKEFSA